MPPTWKDRQPVHSFRLAPGKSFNMVLDVVATAGVAGPLRARGSITTTLAGSRYLFASHLSLIVYVTNKRGGLSL